MGSEKRKERWPIWMLLTSYHHGQLGRSVWGALGPAENTPCDYPPEACSGWNLSTILSCCVWGQGKPPSRESSVLAATPHPRKSKGGGGLGAKEEPQQGQVGSGVLHTSLLHNHV